MKKLSQKRRVFFLFLGMTLLLFLPFCSWTASSTNAQERSSSRSQRVHYSDTDQSVSPKRKSSKADRKSESSVSGEKAVKNAKKKKKKHHDAPSSATKGAMMPTDSGAITGTGGFDARRNADNVAMISGGTRASQNAVRQGLEWIARHQLPNGSWNYNHRLVGNCNCGNPGALMKCTNGATAMGILPFLGCGMTHREGMYQKQVGNGLKFLVGSMKKDPKCPGGGSFHQAEGTMYAHGLATICLTEAYIMTKEKSLRIPAQAALNYVMYAQDPVGGGWRYTPKQPGDTSVTGWQLSALKSGYMGYLQINQQVPAKAMDFLNSVQTESGAKYGYTTPGGAPACTAIGLLCRMYCGCEHDNKALRKGVEFLDKCGPSADMYYNYYATQVMCHYGGDMWLHWNEKMREQLVKKQVKGGGHDKGSWTPGGGHAAQGGRLYETSLSIMTLEVYYRHQPIYKQQATVKPPAID